MKPKLSACIATDHTPSRNDRNAARHHRSIHHLPLTTALIVFSGGITCGADLLKWDVTGSTGTTGNAVAPAAATGVTGSSLTGGGTTGNSTSPASTWNRTFTLNADASTAQAAGNYFSFTTTAASGFTVSISGMTGLNLSRTSTGPTSAALFFSTDGINYTQTGSTFTVGTTLASAAASFDDTIATTPIVIPGGSTVSWRLVVYGGTAASRLGIGNAGTDDFTLTGTSIPDAVTHNLLWTGTGGNNWNTTPSNTNWANTDLANAPAPFINFDNVTLNTAATITIDAGGVNPNNVTVGNTTGTVDLSGGQITAAILTKTGAGTLAIAGTHAFSGGVFLTGGTLQAIGNAALGANSVNINGATLQTAISTTTVANVLVLGTAASTLDNSGAVTFSGQINTTGAAINAANVLTKSGAGVLTLTKTGTSALGSQMNKDSTGGAVELDITAGGVVFSGTGQRNLAGTSTWDAPVTLGGGTLMLHGGTVNGSGTITVSANSTISSRLNYGTATLSNPITVDTGKVLSLDCANGNNALAAVSAISGDGAVTKIGNGTVRIEGTNTYTGITTINAGTLRIGTGTSGTLGTGDVVITAGTLFLNRDDAVTIPNQISGAGNVTGSSGASITTLTGANTYTGVTTCSEGDLGLMVLANGGETSSMGASSLDAANLVLNGGNLAYVGATDVTTDRAFTVGIVGGGISASGTGTVHFTNTDNIVLPDPTPAAVGALNIGTTYKIVTAGTTDFTLVGAPNNNIGTVFTATGPGSGTGTVVYANNRQFRLRGSAPGKSVLDARIGDGTNAPTMLAKNGTTTWSITGTNTYTGTTTITNGTLLIDGDNSAATGAITVVNAAALGGNGVSGGAVTLQSGGGLAARISDWTGAAGTGYDDLTVSSMDAASVPMNLTIDTTGLTHFTETAKSFTILNTTGGITNFSSANVTVTAPGFTGTGHWTLTQSGNSLVLSYALGGNYSTWATAHGISGQPASGDFDNDGLTNLVEYALGLNPTASSGTPGTFSGGTLLFTKGTDAKTNGDVTYEIEQSTTLSGWTVVVPNTPASPTISYLLPTGQPKEFARLKITQIP